MKVLLVLIFSVATCNIFSQNLPKEWMLLFDCLHSHQKNISPEILNSITSNLPSFNSSLNHVPAERVSALMKAILYRHLLETPPATASKNIRSIVFIERFFADYEKKYKSQSCTFTNWIIESLQNDFRSAQQSGSFVGNIQGNAKNPVEAKGVTIQQYVSQWIDFLLTSFEDKESLLINYYGNIIVSVEKTLKTFAIFSPPQPVTITYINWNFASINTGQQQTSSPIQEEDKSAAEIIEKNSATPAEPSKSKSEAIDEILKKKKKTTEIDLDKEEL